MDLITLCDNLFEIGTSVPVKILQGMNPMVISYHWAISLDIISICPVKILQVMNTIDHSSPWAEYLEIIALKPKK